MQRFGSLCNIAQPRYITKYRICCKFISIPPFILFRYYNFKNKYFKYDFIVVIIILKKRRTVK